MGKVRLSDIVNLPAFEEAGELLLKATGMTLSFHEDDGNVIFYPAEEKCDFCSMVQDHPEGRKRCYLSDKSAAEKALRTGQPTSYTCHAGLIDVVVPVVVGGERIGCFYTGQSLLSPPTRESYDDLKRRVVDLGLDEDKLWTAYQKVPQVDKTRLDLSIGLLGVISKHLVEGVIALQRERALTLDQRKLRRAAEEKARLERDLREMELRLLQAQLNPHFLFNSLNLILGNAMAEDAQQTSHLVRELSILLRNSLTSIGSMVTLAEEMANVKAYVHIFQARFGHRLDLEIDLPEDLAPLRMPALLLQPVVENALIHALPASNGSFRVGVTATRVDDLVKVTINDSGPGLAPRDLAALIEAMRDTSHEGKLTGLIGLNRRVNYYYPDVPDVSLQNSPSGLGVTIYLPAADTQSSDCRFKIRKS